MKSIKITLLLALAFFGFFLFFGCTSNPPIDANDVTCEVDSDCVLVSATTDNPCCYGCGQTVLSKKGFEARTGWQKQNCNATGKYKDLLGLEGCEMYDCARLDYRKPVCVQNKCEAVILTDPIDCNKHNYNPYSCISWIADSKSDVNICGLLDNNRDLERCISKFNNKCVEGYSRIIIGTGEDKETICKSAPKDMNFEGQINFLKDTILNGIILRGIPGTPSIKWKVNAKVSGEYWTEYYPCPVENNPYSQQIKKCCKNSDLLVYGTNKKPDCLYEYMDVNTIEYLN
jgi:hypothetical protein